MSKQKILVADDQQESRYYLRKLLEGHGYDVTVAADGDRAFKLVEKVKPDLIITDSLMPNVDGFEFCRRVKRDDNLRHIPVVFYSATYTDVKSQKCAKSLGAVEYLIKPLEPAKIIKIVKGLLSKYERGELKVIKKPLEEKVFLKLYNKELVEKLENKMFELTRSEKKYRELTDLLPQVIFEVDNKGRILFVNRVVFKMFGYTKKDLDKGLSIWQMLAPENLKKARGDVKKLLNGDSLGVEEYIGKRKDNSTFPIIIYTTLVVRGKKVVGFRGIIIDITERKKAEQKLHESEEKFRKLFNSSKDALMTLEPPTWKFTSGNFTILDMFKVKDQKEFTSFGPWDLSPDKQPDGRLSSEKAKAMIQIAMKKGSNFFEWTHKRLNGESFPSTVLLTKVDLKDKTFLQATVRDITEQKKIEHKLLESNARISQMVEGNAIPTFVIDKQHKVTNWNMACAELTGASAKQMIGTGNQWKPFYSKKRPMMADLIVDGKSKREVERYYKEQLIRRDSVIEGIYAGEGYFPHVGGKGKWLYSIAVPLKDSRGEFVGAMETVQDITERVRAKESLEDTVEELEDKNAELKRMTDLMVGRELKMRELKEELRGLKGGK